MSTPDIKYDKTEFCHLHNHSIYSTLDGIATPSQYADQCCKRGYSAMAITEHGHMGSVPDMAIEFQKKGLKFISGVELYFNDYEPERQALTKSVRQVKAEDPDYHEKLIKNRHLTVLAKNEVGYTNLIKLTTQANKTGFYYKGRVWFDKLLEYKEGLIILSGCMNGPVCHELRKEEPCLISKDKRGAVDWIKKFKKAFGEDYFIELQMPGVEDDQTVFRMLVELADMYGLNTVFSNDCHYVSKDDFELQVIMMAIDQNTTIDSPDLFYSNSNEQYFKTRGQLWSRYKTAGYDKGLDDGVFERSCDNTLLIAERCESMKIDASPKIPSFDNADEQLQKLAIRKLVKCGLDKIEKRYIVDGKEVTYLDQLKIELDRIADKGFSSYFLITYDLIRYGKKRGWPFSPRGSAGGSIVNYLLGISILDPLKWGLSFDRFLSPSRGGYMQKVTMPEN